MDGNLSLADVAALNKDGDSNGLLWLLMIFVLLGWGGGVNRNGGSNLVTQQDMTAGLNNQATQAQIQGIALSTQQNNYETANLINSQTNTMMAQQNANMINAIQGFNQLNTSLMNQTNVLASKLDGLGSQMNECCCSIKTQMLNDRLDDRNRELAVAQNALNNAAQTQTILSSLGRFVPWSGSSNPSSAATSTPTA